MCGLTGFIWNSDSKISHVARSLDLMTDAINHRGPDSEGSWIDEKDCISIGHKRLSVLDLTSAGSQPMFSNSKRYVIAFNGEIYNHNTLRSLLNKEMVWNGHSDTETLLACFEHWGVDKTLENLVGMYAIALYDSVEKVLYLVRDRMGEKPLYYGWNNGVFLFGSELKAIKSFPGFSGVVDRSALALYLQYDYVPAPFSIYKGIKKLPQGSYIKIKMNSGRWDSKQILDPIEYWSLKDVALSGQSNTSKKSNEHKLIDKLDDVLSESIEQQMISDVPLGVFLSGGVDSSLVASLMQKNSMDKIQTYTVGFNERSYNEAEYAKKVALHLGTEHTELYVSPEQAIKVIPKLPLIYDEPFADSSQIPTFLVSEMAKKHVTVAISGDGGDELFGGYNRYTMACKIWKNVEKTPFFVRKALSKGITSVSPRMWDNLGSIIPQRLNIAHPGDKAYKFADILLASEIGDVYNRLVSHWENSCDIVIGCNNINKPIYESHFINDEHNMMFLDSVTYLPDDILTKVDRASMASSLETRAPFLNHKVVEFAWNLPLDIKIRDSKGKWIVRKVLDKYVPNKLIDRPKMGFGIPIDSWLRGPLKDWAESLLDESRLKSEGFFHPEPIRKIWAEHLSKQGNWHHHLWSILMFQAWLEQQVDIS
jgi:asparagine synthase (glutamine-hydrolysing)